MEGKRKLLSRGRSCKFSHEQNNPRPSAGETKSAECYAWKDKGSCRFGDKCKFIHIDANGKEVPKAKAKATVKVKANANAAKVPARVLLTKDVLDRNWNSDKDQQR